MILSFDFIVLYRWHWAYWTALYPKFNAKISFWICIVTWPYDTEIIALSKLETLRSGVYFKFNYHSIDKAEKGTTLSWLFSRRINYPFFVLDRRSKLFSVHKWSTSKSLCYERYHHSTFKCHWETPCGQLLSSSYLVNVPVGVEHVSRWHLTVLERILYP